MKSSNVLLPKGDNDSDNGVGSVSDMATFDDGATVVQDNYRLTSEEQGGVDQEFSSTQTFGLVDRLRVGDTPNSPNKNVQTKAGFLVQR